MSTITSKSESRRKRLVEYLRDRRDSAPVAELATTFGVTVRTILRDAEALRENGFEVVGERGRGGGLSLNDAPAAVQQSDPEKSSDIPGGQPKRKQPRAIFVGRASEMAALHAAFDDARAGRGRSVVLAGEPGIGKTMMAQRAADGFSRQGANVLWGRCLETEGALPYWPWAQVVRSYASTCSPEQLASDLGTGAADVGEIVPEIFTWIPDLDRPGSVSTPESARFRLFRSFGVFLENLSRDRPLVLLLEDLHRADKPTLLLLEFIAQQLEKSKILIVGTYRDVELNRRHPLVQSLAELNRQPSFLRLSLRGLDEQEISELLLQASGTTPDEKLVSSLYRQTEGNPLFVSEMTILLLQDSQLTNDSEINMAGAGVRIPEGIREAIGQRLDRLSSGANELLRSVSVLGREFSMLELRQLLAGLPGRSDSGAEGESETLALLDEALQARLLEYSSRDMNRYQFTHSLLRDTLYQELTTLERVRLHELAGQALETLYSSQLSENLPQLAHHFLEAARGGHADKAVKYAEMAGHNAAAMVAHEEAVRYYEMALHGLALTDGPDDSRRCEILMARGLSQQAAGDLLDSRATYTAVAQLASRMGANDLCAEAAIAFETAGWHPGLNGIPAVNLLRDAIARLGEGDSEIKARSLASLGRALYYSGLSETAEEVAAKAIEMARRVGDRQTLAHTLWTRLPIRSDPTQIHERIKLAQEAIQICEELGEYNMAINAEAWLMNEVTELGNERLREEVYQSWRTKVLNLRDPMWIYNLMAIDVGFATAEGRFEDAEQLANSALSQGQRLRGLDAVGIHGAMMFWIRREQGRLHEVRPALELFMKNGPTNVWRPGLAALFAELDLKEQALAEFESMAREDFAAVEHDALFTCAMAYLADVCAYLDDTERARIIYESLEPFEGRNISLGVANVLIGQTSRYLGVLASVMSMWDEAEQHFEDAVRMSENMKAPTQTAHCKYEYAIMLQSRRGPGDSRRAKTLLNEASHIARELDMRVVARKCSESLLVRGPEKPVLTYFPAGLSAREAEVLKLLTGGLVNREIGEELFITANTVANHVKSILQKTGAANRTEAAAFAVRSGVLES